MKLAERSGWACFRIKALAPRGDNPCASLVFHSLSSDDSWTLQFSAKHEYMTVDNLRHVTYDLYWLKAGEGSYKFVEPPDVIFLRNVFELEIAGFVAWLKMTGLWPEAYTYTVDDN